MRDRCLFGGGLIGLAFDPPAHSEGWADGVMRAPMARPPLRSPPLPVPLIPSSLLLPSFIYSLLLIYIPHCLVSHISAS